MSNLTGDNAIMEETGSASSGLGSSSGVADKIAIRRAIVSCGVGQMFELYDFLIYAFMAAPLSRAFFPSDDPVASLLATFATFAVGFIIRPVGAVVIGAYGDKHGRRAALVLTIGLMAVGTGAIGLIPSYATLGILAPVLLVLCRIAQGFSAGGEWGGAAAFLAEYAPPESRGFISSFQQAATAVGLLLATVVSYLLTTLLDPAAFDSWGWRLAFLLGFVLGPVGHYLRKHVQETPAFELAREHEEEERAVEQVKPNEAPLIVTFRDYTVPAIAALVLSIVGVVVNYVFMVFLPSFAQEQLHIPASISFLSAMVAAIVYLVLSPAFGALSDRIGRKPILFAMSLASAVFAYPLFLLMVSMPTAGGLILAQALSAILLAMFCGPICALLSEMFPTRIRYTALSITYGLAVSIFGGLAPYVSTLLIQVTSDPLAPSYYVVIAGIVSFIAVFFVEERVGKPLPE